MQERKETCARKHCFGRVQLVPAKHQKCFLLIDCISVGVDGCKEPSHKSESKFDAWQRSELTELTAKVVIDEAFVERKSEAPKAA